MASQKQVGYVFHLLAEAGYPTKFMSAQFSDLGATMRECSGTVESWLEDMTSPQISQLIDQLGSGTRTAVGSPHVKSRRAATGAADRKETTTMSAKNLTPVATTTDEGRTYLVQHKVYEISATPRTIGERHKASQASRIHICWDGYKNSITITVPSPSPANPFIAETAEIVASMMPVLRREDIVTASVKIARRFRDEFRYRLVVVENAQDSWAKLDADAA